SMSSRCATCHVGLSFIRVHLRVARVVANRPSLHAFVADCAPGRVVAERRVRLQRLSSFQYWSSLSSQTVSIGLLLAAFASMPTGLSRRRRLGAPSVILGRVVLVDVSVGTASAAAIPPFL